MLEFLNTIDTQLFLFLNGLHNPFFDGIMAFITRKETWYPLYLVILVYMMWKYKKRSLIILPAVILLIVLSDQISVHWFKNVFKRLRPSRVEELQSIIHLVGKKGGKYGFVSSHAANSFGAATFLALLFRNRIFTISILIWAAVVSYSRIYVGVHYPGDILFGGLLGIGLGFLVTKLREWAETKLLRPEQQE
ncbi:MAG: phosphatase PAP2 family protein [Candidatus Marinimicrobia bacterium]|nr:phosphatase PAP2 family protein [Candidatus Neomarinimicrobiota bacterium]